MEIQALSQHEHALRFRALRNQVLSSNIANADTPGYKARDIDFSTALKSAQNHAVRMRATSDRHIGGGFVGAGHAREIPIRPHGGLQQSVSAQYRVPTQPTLDGNTVETDVEQAQFAENALMYRATLAFLDGQIKSLKYALRGGD